MGSYNLACVATNTPLMEGDRCVAYLVDAIEASGGRGDPGDAIRSSHYIASFPMRGVYADYGMVDTDCGKTIGDRATESTDNAIDGDIMIFHETAYDTIKAEDAAIRAEHKVFTDKYYAENGVPEYKLTQRADVKAGLEALENNLVSDNDLPQWEAYSLLTPLVHAPEGEEAYAVFWRGVLQGTDKPTSCYAKFKEEVDWLYGARHTFHFHFHPSYYAGQECEVDALLALAETTVARLKAQ